MRAKAKHRRLCEKERAKQEYKEIRKGRDGMLEGTSESVEKEGR